MTIGWARRKADEALFQAYLERLERPSAEMLCIKDRFGYQYRKFSGKVHRRDALGRWRPSKHKPNPPFRMVVCHLPLAWALKRLAELPDGSVYKTSVKGSPATLTKITGEAVLEVEGLKLAFGLGSDDAIQHAERKLYRLMNMVLLLRKTKFIYVDKETNV